MLLIQFLKNIFCIQQIKEMYKVKCLLTLACLEK